MSERKSTLTVERIVVALDASPHSRAALEAAVEMASRFKAELLGLFVEDINLLRAAELPFAHELGGYSAHRRRMRLERLERQLRARSRGVRRLFTVLTKREAVAARFRISRGRVATEIRAATEETGADVLVVGRAGWSYVRRRRLGSTARIACGEDLPQITVVMEEGRQIAPPILVAYDGSYVGEKAMMIGVQLVEKTSEPLRVLLLARQTQDVDALKAQADRLLRSYDVMHQYRAVVATTVGKLALALRSLQQGTLVVPASVSLSEEDSIVDLIERVDMPVVLVR
ncbi:MAG: universal stress protein [Anaerolineae bacterium]